MLVSEMEEVSTGSVAVGAVRRWKGVEDVSVWTGSGILKIEKVDGQWRRFVWSGSVFSEPPLKS